MKDDNESQKSTTATSSSQQPAASPSASTSAAATPSASSSQATSKSADSQSKQSSGRNILSADVEIIGKINFTNDLVVDGKIEGEIESNGSLTVGENARIKAEIKTRSVVIYGKVHGNITVTGGVELKKDAELIGDIVAGTLAIEAGAIFLGKSTVGKASAVVTAANSAVKPTASVASAKPVSIKSPTAK
ncbi:polymer-forming cytoskeletal protein [Akkermansiaceae bacterium]|nr:polymer-forming cytoskeletal protein [Akkermansiaceae bacterium]